MSSLDVHPAHALMEDSLAFVYRRPINETILRNALSSVLGAVPHLAGLAWVTQDGLGAEVVAYTGIPGIGVPLVTVRALSVRVEQLQRNSAWLSRTSRGTRGTNPLAPRLPVALALQGAPPLLAVQLTLLAAGGAAIGLTFSHHVFDWQAAELFMLAVAKTAAAFAEGKEAPSHKVFYAPELLEARADGAPAAFVPESFQPVGGTWHQLKLFGGTAITLLRENFEEVNVVAPSSLAPRLQETCVRTASSNISIFDCVVAMVWQEVVRSNSYPKRPTALRQTVSLRGQRLTPPLLEGYLGNANIPRVTPAQRAKDVMEAPLSDLAALVRSTRDSVTGRLACDELQALRELREAGELGGSLPALAPPGAWRNWDPRDLVIVMDLRGDHYAADFGSGRPLWVHHHLMDFLGQMPAGGPTIATISSSPPDHGGLEVRAILQTGNGQANRFREGWLASLAGLRPQAASR